MRLSLAFKILIFVIFNIIILSVGLALFFIMHEQKVIENDLFNRTRILAKNTAYNSEYYLLVGDYETMKRLLSELIKEKDLVYASVERINGKVFAQAGHREHSLYKEIQFPIETLTTPETEDSFSSLSLGRVEKQKLGDLTLGFSLAETEAKISEIKQQIAIATLIAIIISCLGVYV
ncbi:hypothetical protein ACFL27_20685, partial [candidate division CSSED10-310 bacterium]